MEKIQIYLRKEEIVALQRDAERSGRSVADLARNAIRKFALTLQVAGPVAIWDGVPKRSSVEHDSVNVLSKRDTARVLSLLEDPPRPTRALLDRRRSRK
jgi:hypothetical protein